MPTTTALHILRDEHASIAAMLNSLLSLAEAGPGDTDRRDFFDTIAAMLFYVDEFPERRHHPTESDLLFPMLLEAAPELRAVIHRLEMDHAAGEGRVRELAHLAQAWHFVGETRRAAFVSALDEYVRFYLRHMRLEETELLPLITTRLSARQQAELDSAFEASRDPLAGGRLDPVYQALFQRITAHTRSPIGLQSA